jgi:hypothetical protein
MPIMVIPVSNRQLRYGKESWSKGSGFGLPLRGDSLLLNGLNPKQMFNSNAQRLKTSKKVRTYNGEFVLMNSIS